MVHTCGEPDEIKKNTHPGNILPLFWVSRLAELGIEVDRDCLFIAHKDIGTTQEDNRSAVVNTSAEAAWAGAMAAADSGDAGSVDGVAWPHEGLLHAGGQENFYLPYKDAHERAAQGITLQFGNTECSPEDCEELRYIYDKGTAFEGWPMCFEDYLCRAEAVESPAHSASGTRRFLTPAATGKGYTTLYTLAVEWRNCIADDNGDGDTTTATTTTADFDVCSNIDCDLVVAGEDR